MDPSPVDDDTCLLDGAINGDRRCIEALVLKYQDFAYAIAIRIVGNHQDAEEIVQDSFSRAFRSLNNFNKLSRFSTWLYRIAYNISISKKRKRSLRYDSIDENTEINIESNQMKRSAFSSDQADANSHLHAALSCLSEEDRVILTLHYLAEKSVDDVGNILSIKRSAVKMRLMRARKRLVQELNTRLGSEMKDIL